MNQFTISVEVVSTPEELALGGEMYTALHRQIDLPIVPYVGMTIFFNPNDIKGDRADRWLRLKESLKLQQCAFKVESINVFVGDIDGENPDFTMTFLQLAEVFEPTLSRFRARIHLFEQFYGFHRI